MVCCAVLTLSDTRTPETDRSGQVICDRLSKAGHEVHTYSILADDPALIQSTLTDWVETTPVQAFLLNGGTGIALRDTTYDALRVLFEKELPGFGELFRMLSFQEIGSRAIASRATAGVYRSRLIFSMPGSTAAVTLAMDKLVLPELGHLIRLLSTVDHR